MMGKGVIHVRRVNKSRSRRRRVRTVFGRSAGAVAIGDPPSDLLIPLLLTPPPEEADDDHGHVVAAHTTRLRVGGQTIVHHVLADLLQILLGGDSSPDKLDNGLRGLAVPDA